MECRKLRRLGTKTTSACHFAAIATAMIALAAFPSRSFAGDVDPAVQSNFDRLIQAVQVGDRNAILKDATDDLKKALTQDVVDLVTGQVGPDLAKGFQSEHVCELKQQGCQVELWKITFKDGKDDMIVRIATRGGHLAGLFLQ